MIFTSQLSANQRETIKEIEEGLKSIGISRFKLQPLFLSKDVLEIFISNIYDFEATKKWLLEKEKKIDMQKQPEKGSPSGYLYVVLD